MTSCFEFELLINQKLDHELSEAEEELLTLHLQTCANCRTLYEDLASLQETLSSFSVSPPPNLHARIMDRIKEETTVTPPILTGPIRKSPLSKWFGVAAALLLLVSGTVLGIRMGTSTSDSATLENGETYSLSDSTKRSILASECEPQPEVDAPECPVTPDIENKAEQNDSVRQDAMRKGLPKESTRSESEENLDKTDPPTDDIPSEPEMAYDSPPPSLCQNTPDEEMPDTRSASLSPEGISFDEAETLLLQFLSKEGKSTAPQILYQGISPDGAYYLFLYTDDSGADWNYPVSRTDGTILLNPPQEHLSVDN